jgi:transcriptional regulator with XRE-family HTH domain
MHASTKTIKILLLKKGVSIEELAQRFGCKRQELSMLINRAPYREYPELQKKLAKFLGVPARRLFPVKAPARTGRSDKRAA